MTKNIDGLRIIHFFHSIKVTEEKPGLPLRQACLFKLFKVTATVAGLARATF